MSFGSRLKFARTEARLSQNELVKALDWESSVNRISAYETDKSEPNLSDIKKMAEVLNVNQCWLAFGNFRSERMTSIKIDKNSESIDYISGLVHGEKYDSYNCPYYIFKHSIQGFVVDEDKAVISIEFNEHWPATEIEIKHGIFTTQGIYIQFKDKDGEFQRLKRELQS